MNSSILICDQHIIVQQNDMEEEGIELISTQEEKSGKLSYKIIVMITTLYKRVL